MAATSSINGLVSGLDTDSIITSLMQVEAQPQTILKTRVSTESSNISTLQTLNAKFAALATKAAALATSSSFTPVTTTSSSTAVTAVAGSTAAPGSLSFTVQQNAAAHQLTFTSTAASGDVVTSGSTTVNLTKHDGTVVALDTGDGTLSGLVKAINGANAGVTASTVKLDDGSFRLRVASDTTGAASDFTLTNEDGSDLLGGATVTAGQDAELLVGSDTVHSSSNTFTGLTTGLDVTVAAGTAAGTAVTVTSTRDSATAKSSVQGLVDSANEILASIDSLTSYDTTTQKSGALSGDSTVRDLRQKLLDTVTRAADGTSMADLGVATDRYGKITFDTTKFDTAYASNPGAVAAKLGAASTADSPGFAARLAAVATTASDSTTGVLTTDIVGRQSSVTTMQASIDNWDLKLADRKATLTKTYSSLEVSLQKLQSQSSWLSSQLSALSSSSSSSS